jgi:tRNA(fMet)-specific endonuclease VapC
MIILDTDHLSELQRDDSKRRVKLVQRLDRRGERTVATTIISVEEALRGRLATIHSRPAGSQQVIPYMELLDLLTFCAEWLILPFDPTSADRFQQLRTARVRIGTMDLKIASIALVHGATLLSANLRDFRQVPGLAVEDWLS